MDRICVGILLAILSVESLRILQQVGYCPERGYFRVYLSRYGLLLIFIQCISVAMYLYSAPIWTVSCLYAVVGISHLLVRRKCPVVYTKRLLRTFCVQSVICMILAILLPWFVVAFIPCLVLISWAVLLPVERKIAIRYQKSATKKIVESGIKVIAVTGSYGKTTTKNMLVDLLGDKACSPSGSCNTPLGIAKFINGNDLSKNKYLVLEFGARKRGDIAELCRLYPPDYCVITGICPQHLSTFGTIDNIIKEKLSLVEALPENGVCVLNGVDDLLRQTVIVGKSKHVFSGTNVTARSLATEIDGQTIQLTSDGQSHLIKLPQIADYAASTLAVCAEMCLALGMSFEEIVANVCNIRQCPHRMQVILNGGLCIVDDSYNASIEGVRAACKTIGKLNGRKIVIAQGIVECGKKRKTLNFECGRVLGETFDAVVLVGKNSAYLQQGCRCTSTCVIFADGVQNATTLAVERLCGNGVIYYQNDLPDAPTM